MELTQCCVIRIECIILGRDLAVHHTAARSPAEVAPSRRRRRSHAPDLATRRSLVHVHATRPAAAAKHPTEIATEVPALRRTSQRESPDLGKFHRFVHPSDDVLIAEIRFAATAPARKIRTRSHAHVQHRQPTTRRSETTRAWRTKLHIIQTRLQTLSLHIFAPINLIF